MKTIHTITEVIENNKKNLKVNTDKGLIGFYIKKKNLLNENQFEIERTEISEIDAEFWKQVSKLNGMAVCDPFIERFKGHSFVAYDAGFVWSSTLKAAFKTEKGITLPMGVLPKSCKALFSFGSDLSTLNK